MKVSYNKLFYCVVYCFFWFMVAFSHDGHADTSVTEPLPLYSESALVVNATLADLEPRVNATSSVQAEIASLEELLAKLEHERALSGWKIVGSIRSGYMDEQLTTDQRREYYPSQLSLGLTYPLFGKLREEKISVLGLQANAENEKLQIEIKKQEAIEALRLSYILLWAAELKVSLAEAFLQERDFYLEVLKKRVSTGHLLEADYLEFASALELVARERFIFENTASRARDLIHTLTGLKLNSPLQFKPDLPASSNSIEQAVSTLADSPEILLYQNNVEHEMEKLQLSSGLDIKGNVTVRGIVGASEYVQSEYGYGGTISLDLALPLNPFSAGRARTEAERLSLRRHQYQLKSVTEEIKATILERYRKSSAEQQNVLFAQTRLQAAAELLREKRLRVGRIDGDVLEQLQKARFNYFRVAVDFIEADARRLQSVARLLRYCPSLMGKRRVVLNDSTVIKPLNKNEEISSSASMTALLKQPTSQSSGRPLLVTYVWNSEPYLNGAYSLQQFSKHNIDKVLISLNRRQINELSSVNGRKNLHNFLKQCRVAEISPGLLLGEPTWILPEFRQDLLIILRLLNEFNFDGVHLDLEPYQLEVEKYGLDYLAAQLLRTIQLAGEISDFPLEISLHPRFLQQKEIPLCFGCALNNLELERVVVMIYSTDTQNLRLQMAGFSAAYPELKLAVAQSVETVIGPQNSYAHHDLKEFYENLQQLMGDSGKGWRGDVYIQDWASYLQMHNENRHSGLQGKAR